METDEFKFEAETNLDLGQTKVALLAHAEFIALDFAIEHWEIIKTVKERHEEELALTQEC